MCHKEKNKTMNGKHLVTVIRKSCITGQAVWVYQGPSEHAARQAYSVACRKETERIRGWGRRTAQRERNIGRLLSECLAEVPINQPLTPGQEEAVRRLKEMQRKPPACHRDFYEHFTEERRRRRQDREIRRKTRERENENKRNYDK